MTMAFVVRDVFRLAGGTTVLACEGEKNAPFHVGQADLVGADEVRQSLAILGERAMLNPSVPSSLRAFETRDAVQLSAEEARSGVWRLVFAQ